MPLPSDIDANFVPALRYVAAQLGANPLDIANLLYSESGIRASIANSLGYSGINQFSASNLEAMGIEPDAYRQLPASVQLTQYVFPWWQKLVAAHHVHPVTARDLYWLNFLPATYVPGAPDSHVIADANVSATQAGWVHANPGFAQGKSYITAGDLQSALVRARSQNPTRWAAIAGAVGSSGGMLAAAAGTIGLVIGVGAAIAYAWPPALKWSTWERLLK